jgi:DNA-binding transcriptional MocR family regulator
MNARATFDSAPAAGVINFGIGQPSADLLPMDLVRQASERFFEAAQPLELNYGPRQGSERFRESLAGFLGANYGSEVRADDLMLTCGNSQALDFVCERFTQPGDRVFVEEPTYFLAHQIFLDHGLEIVEIPVDGHGLDLDRLEAALGDGAPRLLYTIPSYHNPTGQTLGESRRHRLVELAEQHGFIIVADEVYQLLGYYDAPPPPLGAWAESGPVLSLGSFSKILAPSLRLGWIQTNAGLMGQLLASGALNSGGSFNHFTSHLVRHAIDAGLLSGLIDQLRVAYRQRLEAMDQALRAQLGDQARWMCPQGGYFFWLQFEPGMDTTPFRARALESGTGFQPGAVFSNQGDLRNFLRLSFAHYGPAEITEGIARLTRVLNS